MKPCDATLSSLRRLRIGGEFFMHRIAAIVIALAMALQAVPPSDTCNPKMWVTNSYVSAIAPVGDKVYIGGAFTYVGPYTGCGVPIDSSTGAPLPAFPKINGAVYASCADGNGGWFIGGVFTAVEGVPRNNIAHILPGRSLDTAWNPNPSGMVGATIRALATALTKSDNFLCP
jgi:hypothetical protein